MAKHVITPAWQTSRGPIVQAHGCAVGVPVAGAKVFGETRQNLWVNPSGTNAGITCTSNDDGSLTISGTNATGSDVYLYSDVIEAIPYGKQVTFSASNYGVAGECRFVLTGIGGATPDGPATFTAAKPSTGRPGTVAVIVTPGTTVNATVRVMLNEGSSAEPWCPPGLTSVSELGVVSAGKNLLRYLPGLAQSTTNGITFTPQEDGGIKVQGTASSEAYFNIDYVSSYESAISNAIPFVGRQVTASKKGGEGVNFGVGVFTGPGSQNWKNFISLNGTATAVVPDDALAFRSILSVASGTTVDTVIYPQLELGSQATTYEPPHVTTTPIDLSGHQLRSLPDGTRDVLTWDGSGAVSVEQAVKCLTIDGTNVKAAYKNSFQFSLLDAYRSVPVSDEGVAEIFCDSLPVASAANIWKGSSIGIGVNSSGTIVFAPPGNLSTIEEANAWLAQHPVTVIYPVATTTTVPLDPIAPPTVPAADATLWAASDVPCDIEATTWTASGAEQGRQQAAMVKVAQQVRQQAETMAALAAQSLEA